MISYIVSCYNHPEKLVCCLASLSIQDPAGQILVADNSDDWLASANCRIRAEEFGAQYFHTTGGCYTAAESMVPRARGKWLCFPSDDSYYVPGFSRIMLQAAKDGGWDFVYCDCLYDPRRGGEYSVLPAHPSLGSLDKTNFIVRKDVFEGFPPHESDWRDGALAISLVDRGVRHGKAPGILVVHN